MLQIEVECLQCEGLCPVERKSPLRFEKEENLDNLAVENE